MGLMFSSFNKLNEMHHCLLLCSVHLFSIPLPDEGDLKVIEDCTHKLHMLSYFYFFSTCLQSDKCSFCLWNIFLCHLFSGLHYIAVLIFDCKSYCSSKLSKPLRSCGKLLSPFVVNDAAGTSACSGIVTSLWLYFYSLREGNSTFRGYTASYIAPKELGLGDVGIGKELEGAAPSGKMKLLLFTSPENQLSRR